MRQTVETMRWSRVSVLLAVLSAAAGARILAVFPTPSYSHQIVFHALVRGLAAQGHELLVLSPNKLDNRPANVTQIDLGFLYDDWRRIDFATIASLNLLFSYTQFSVNSMRKILSLPEVRTLIGSDDSFDAVLVEYLGYQPMYAFAGHFNAPLIGVSSFDMGASEHAAIGNVHHPVLHPLNFLPYHGNGKLNIIERVGSVTMYLIYRFLYEPVVRWEYNKIIKSRFGGGSSSSRSISVPQPDLLLINAHPALGFVRPMVTNSIAIGFLHVRPPAPLPPHLQVLLDKAASGAVFFSLGTNVNSSMIPRVLEKVLAAFEDTPYILVIKWNRNPVDSPKRVSVSQNVHIFDWLPQQDVLAHKNIRLFITQGGQQSVEEAIDRAVPMVIMPVFGDQFASATRMEALGVAEQISIKTFTPTELRVAVIRIMRNHSIYKERLHQLRNIIADQPFSPIETAVWWVEYVIRNRGTKDLQYHGLKTPWYQFYQIDVILIWTTLLSAYVLCLKQFMKFVRIRWSQRKLKLKMN